MNAHKANKTLSGSPIRANLCEAVTAHPEFVLCNGPVYGAELPYINKAARPGPGRISYRSNCGLLV